MIDLGSHWNYRVVKRTVNGVVTYAIHECYYDGAHQIESVTKDPTAPVEDSAEDLQETLTRMLRACKSPAVDYDKLKD